MKVSRSQLAKFLPDNESIRLMEELVSVADGADAKIGAMTKVSGVSASDTTLVTAVSSAVAANQAYKFEFWAAYTSAVGTRWTVDGPAGTVIYTSQYSLTATSTTTNHLNAYNLPAAANASSAAGNTVSIDGVVIPSVNGTLAIKFAAASASPVNLVHGYLRLIRLT